MKLWICLLLLISLPAEASWIKARGSAPIINGDVEFAREQATQDALRQAMLQAGASVSSIQNLSNGALTRDMFQIRANSEVRQYRLLEEERRHDRLFVTLQAMIIAEPSRCSGSRYAKAISLVRFRMADSDQARYGQIYDLNKEVTRQIFNRLSNLRQNFVARRWLDENLGMDPRRLQQGENSYRRQLQSLAATTDSQYLLFGILQDVSLRDPDGNLLDKWLDDPVRHFSLQLYLFDGMTGEMIDQNNYQGEAIWSFGKQEQVDVSSQKFWGSSYGMEVAAQINRAVQDLQLKTQCNTPVARIMHVDGDNFHINLGKRNNIKNGDRFYIEQRADYNDNYGEDRTLRNPAMGTMEVKQVYDNNAVMRPLNRYAPGNIQVNDLAVME